MHRMKAQTVNAIAPKHNNELNILKMEMSSTILIKCNNILIPPNESSLSVNLNILDKKSILHDNMML